MNSVRLVAGLASVGLAGCLQVEPPPPAGSLVTELTSMGLDADSAFVTGDGWAIELETAALSAGEVRLMGERCNQYSESNYLRVFDLRRPEVQRVNVTFALGECEMGFAMFTPAVDAVVGPGIDVETVAFMRVVAGDPFVSDRGVAFLMRGRAAKAGREVRFDWPFRQPFGFDCSMVNLEADAVRSVRLGARVPALFRLGGDEGTSRFDEIAAADVDQDGEATLVELGAAPAVDGAGDGDSVGEQLYFTGVPDVLALANGQRCRAHPLERGPRAD